MKHSVWAATLRYRRETKLSRTISCPHRLEGPGQVFGEKARIEKLEFLDEFEEWRIIMSHYFGLVAGHCSQTAKTNPIYAKLSETVRIKE